MPDEFTIERLEKLAAETEAFHNWLFANAFNDNAYEIMGVDRFLAGAVYEVSGSTASWIRTMATSLKSAANQQIASSTEAVDLRRRELSAQGKVTG